MRLFALLSTLDSSCFFVFMWLANTHGVPFQNSTFMFAWALGCNYSWHCQWLLCWRWSLRILDRVVFSSSDPSELTLPDRKKRGRPPKKRKHEDPQLRCDKTSLFCCQCQLPVTKKCLHVHVLSTCTVFAKDNSESFCHCRCNNCSPHDLWTFFFNLCAVICHAVQSNNPNFYF